MHVLLFNIEIGERLSSQFADRSAARLCWCRAWAAITGCGVSGAAASSPAREIDPIEATPYTAAGCRFAQRDRGAADVLVKRRRRFGRARGGLYPVGQRSRRLFWAAAFICAAPISASWSAAVPLLRFAGAFGAPLAGASMPSSW